MHSDNPSRAAQGAYTRADLITVLAMLILLGAWLGWALPTEGAETTAFRLEGSFKSTFQGKPHNAGSFSLRSHGPKALIGITFENGFQQFLGTDGQHSYVYNPFTGSKDANTNANGSASIANGRFPATAHLFGKVLWLMTVQDSELLDSMKNRSFEFYQDYETHEIAVEILTLSNSGAPTKIQWFAPGVLALGKNRYQLAFYNQGWLLADILATNLQHMGDTVVPKTIVYTHYSAKATTRAAELQDQGPKSRNDVIPVETVVFTVTNAVVEKPLNSYVPELPDPSALVFDSRNQKLFRVASGRWWAENLPGEPAGNSIKRTIILCTLMLLSAISMFALWRVAFLNGNNQPSVKNEKLN